MRKIFIKIGLFLLRLGGNKPIQHETKQQVQKRRESFFPQLERAGYHIEKKTDYQFRINGTLDIYPVNAKWHDIKKNKRGSFAGKNLARFVRVYFQEI